MYSDTSRGPGRVVRYTCVDPERQLPVSSPRPSGIIDRYRRRTHKGIHRCPLRSDQYPHTRKCRSGIYLESAQGERTRDLRKSDSDEALSRVRDGAHKSYPLPLKSASSLLSYIFCPDNDMIKAKYNNVRLPNFYRPSVGTHLLSFSPEDIQPAVNNLKPTTTCVLL